MHAARFRSMATCRVRARILCSIIRKRTTNEIPLWPPRTVGQRSVKCNEPSAVTTAACATAHAHTRVTIYGTYISLPLYRVFDLFLFLLLQVRLTKDSLKLTKRPVVIVPGYKRGPASHAGRRSCPFSLASLCAPAPSPAPDALSWDASGPNVPSRWMTSPICWTRGGLIEAPTGRSNRGIIIVALTRDRPRRNESDTLPRTCGDLTEYRFRCVPVHVACRRKGRSPKGSSQLAFPRNAGD